MLFTPPFSRLESKSDEDGFAVKHVKYNKRDDSELIADRPRCSVMGVVFNQLDQVTSVNMLFKMERALFAEDQQALLQVAPRL